MTDAEIDALTDETLTTAVDLEVFGGDLGQAGEVWVADGDGVLLILARMEAQGWREITLFRYERGGKMIWEADFQRREGGLIYDSTARTLPEAVCRAALKAVRAQEEAEP